MVILYLSVIILLVLFFLLYIIYVDNSLLTKNDTIALAELKDYLKQYFVTKDMGRL